MRSGHHWFFPVAPSHAERKKERQVSDRTPPCDFMQGAGSCVIPIGLHVWQVFVAEICRYDSRLISYTERMRSYMKTFYELSVKAKVSSFLEMSNLRSRLLEELRREGSTLHAAYEAVLDSLMAEVVQLENDAVAHRLAAHAARMHSRDTKGGPDASSSSSQDNAHMAQMLANAAVVVAVEPPEVAQVVAVDPLPREEERLGIKRMQSWDLERRRNLARYFVLPILVKASTAAALPLLSGLPDHDHVIPVQDDEVVHLEAAILTRSLMARGDKVLTTSTCGNCWEDVPEQVEHALLSRYSYPTTSCKVISFPSSTASSLP